MSGIMKAQIDWIPLALGAVRPTQGKTLAVMQVSGGSQSFNAVNQLRVLGRWMRMITIPNQSSVAKAFLEFTDDGRMKPSAYYDRVVDVMEELFKFTLLTRDVSSLPRRPLQRAQGDCGRIVQARQPAFDLNALRPARRDVGETGADRVVWALLGQARGVGISNLTAWSEKMERDRKRASRSRRSERELRFWALRAPRV